MKLYKPCNPSYPNSSPCTWMLDGPHLKYYWHPKDNCSIPYRSFDLPDFCDVAGGGAIMVVGDSVSMYAADSWKNYILSKAGVTLCPTQDPKNRFTSSAAVHMDPTSVKADAPAGETAAPDEFPFCNNLKLYQFRDLTLTPPNSSHVFKAYNGQTWLENIKLLNVSMLIINTGAHFRSDEELLRTVNETLNNVRKLYPYVNIVWRSTPHGFHMFKNYLLAHPLKREDIMFDKYDQPLYYPEGRSAWNYGDFNRQNHLIQRLLNDYFPEVLYFDVFTPTVLRPDSRHDHIHHCVPGPMDTWLEILYNIFILIWRK